MGAKKWHVPKLEYWQAPCVADAALPPEVAEALRRAKSAAGGREDVLPLCVCGDAVLVDREVWESWFGECEPDLTARRMAQALIEFLERGNCETG